jgi:hypothetical protein
VDIHFLHFLGAYSTLETLTRMKSSIPIARLKTSQNKDAKSKKSKKNGSCLRSIVESIFFIIWLICTGIAGYFVGYSPTSHEDCPEVPQIIDTISSEQAVKCNSEKLLPIEHNAPLLKGGGFTFEEIQTMWKCSHAEANVTEVHKELFPEDMSLDKTKWKSIITVEPKAFFDKYLQQYPGDTKAVQPVVIFSHKPLQKFDELSEVCKVLDVAIVPDKPGVCVAITETYHDVASYHMLHADRQTDGTFALTANSLEGRTLPDEKAYAAARALLLDFFKYGEVVQNAVKDVPRFNKNRVVVGCLVEDSDDLELVMNSVASAARAGISKTKFSIFTTKKQVLDDLSKTGIKVVYLPELATFGTIGDANVGPKLRRYFLQAWISFAAANSLNKVMWQTPGTVWIDRPDNIVNAHPIVESLWVYKGRNDPRAAPFFISFDFFVPLGVERPIHLLHEIIMHFDLVIAWDSLDAVASYRLSENNSRLL